MFLTLLSPLFGFIGSFAMAWLKMRQDSKFQEFKLKQQELDLQHEMAMLEQSFKNQQAIGAQKIEEIGAISDFKINLEEIASKNAPIAWGFWAWFLGSVRLVVTYYLVFRIVEIFAKAANLSLSLGIDSFISYLETDLAVTVIATFGYVIGYWFGNRTFEKKGK